MDPELLRAALGLPADATDEQVTTAAEAQKAEHEAATPAEPTEPAAPVETPAPVDPEPTEPAEPTAPVTDPAAPAEPAAPEASTVTVDKEVWEQTVQGAKEGAAARAEQVTERREGLLHDAAKAGKIPPASVDHYRKLHQADAKGTEKLLEELAPGVIPVSARGSSKADELTGGNDQLAAAMASFNVPVVGR